MEENEAQKLQVDPKIMVVGINLAVLVAYTIYFRINRDNEGLIIIGEAFFIGIQIFICLIAAIFVYRKEFLLSALVVLLIGFSTCLAVFAI